MASVRSRAQSLTLGEWQAEATLLFGNPKNWSFSCPSCGAEASVADFVEAGAPNPYSAAGQECIGRYRTDAQTDRVRGCDYAAYGLIPLDTLQPVKLPGGKVLNAFPFATHRGNEA